MGTATGIPQNQRQQGPRAVMPGSEYAWGRRAQGTMAAFPPLDSDAYSIPQKQFRQQMELSGQCNPLGLSHRLWVVICRHTTPTKDLNPSAVGVKQLTITPGAIGNQVLNTQKLILTATACAGLNIGRVDALNVLVCYSSGGKIVRSSNCWARG